MEIITLDIKSYSLARSEKLWEVVRYFSKFLVLLDNLPEFKCPNYRAVIAMHNLSGGAPLKSVHLH